MNTLDTLQKATNEVCAAIEMEKTLNRACMQCTWGYCIGETCPRIKDDFVSLFARRNKLNEELRKFENN